MTYRLLSVAEMVAVEQVADAAGHHYAAMMAHAGANMAHSISIAYSHAASRKIVALVGKGNNGGDALVAMKHLSTSGWDVSVVLVASRDEDDALLADLTCPVLAMGEEADESHIREALRTAAVVVDGVLGTGITLPLREPLAGRLAWLRDVLLAIEPRPAVVAVDCPSGVDCDTGEAAAETISAERTVCMGAMKTGLLAFPAYDLAGEIELVGIGLPEDFAPLAAHPRFVLDREWASAQLPARPNDAHKGTFGKALIVGGSLHYPGASVLAGEAAFRSGAGWVELAVPEAVAARMAARFAEATWNPLPAPSGGLSDEVVPAIAARMERVTAMLVGPGLGAHEGAAAFVQALLNACLETPTVIDAEALAQLPNVDDWTAMLPPDTILTPHPGEMSTLTGLPVEAIQAARIRIAETYAARWNCIVVLKGAFTAVAAPDGRTAVMPLATPALARAGTGDVLAGIITGLRAQGMPAFEAAACGVWLHGQAGLAAARERGSSAGVLAGDVIAEIGAGLN